MSWLYITVTWFAALLVANDVGLGNMHLVKGIFLMIVLVWNTAYKLWKIERKRCK